MGKKKQNWFTGQGENISFWVLNENYISVQSIVYIFDRRIWTTSNKAGILNWS